MEDVPKVSILPLLRALSTSTDSITPADITEAISHIFRDELSPVQAGALLTSLHFTKLDQEAGIIAAAASAMRGAGLKVGGLRDGVFGNQGSDERYGGGLVSYQ